MARITNDVTLLQRSMSSVLANVVKEIFTIMALSVILIYHDWKLTCIAVFVFPWALIPIRGFGKKGRRYSTRSQEKVGKISTFLHETITGCRIVKAFSMEEYENRRFTQENFRLFRVRLKRLRVRALSSPVMEFIGGLAGAAVIFYGGYNVIKGTASMGTFFSFLTALLLLYAPIKNLSIAYQDVQEGLAAAVRIFHILDTIPEVQEDKNAKILPPISDSVIFNHVNFGYDQHLVLRDINLKIKSGEIIAIVGRTGAGKTSLLNLMPRFYDVCSGEILIDGYNIKKVTLHSLRSQISLVTQQTILFNDSVRNNIAYGMSSQNERTIVEAAKAAYAHHFIKELPDGYATSIGEKGVKLSGGQRQRITIARAFFKDAPILILDEATSALDSQSEEEIQQALWNLMRDRTTLIIAHRLSTIRKAHRIIVLAEGSIVEEGTHEELLQRNGEYRGLYSVYFHENERQLHTTRA
jgi:subfamily B ATP-binding cassette protein MsbA